MNFWEWERLESYVEANYFRVSEPGPLLSPVRSVRFWRDDKLQLVMETRSAQRQSSFRAEQHPPGTVRLNEDFVALSSPGGGSARAVGVLIKRTKSNSNHQHGIHETVETCSLHHFETETPRKGEVAYSFDWVANIDKAYYIWPDSVSDSTEEVSTRSFGSGAGLITLTAKSSSESGSRNCLDITLGGVRVILGSTIIGSEMDKVKPGYILYDGDPDEKTRKRIRDSLSFALGFPIVALGFAKYDGEQYLLSFKLINGYSMDGKALGVPAMPPASICEPAGSNMLDKAKVEKVAGAFFESYNNYGLSSLNWVYWHAVTAPMHMAAAYFGAAIESIQKKYIDAEGKKFNNLIIPKEQYSLLRSAVIKAVTDCDLSPDIKAIFQDKIYNGNTISLKVRSGRFFEHLGITMGSAELNAWQRRNDAAHGNDLAEEDYISLIRDTKLLKVILHRIVLKVTAASENYIDYYSLNFPVRDIRSEVSS
jgi:hypothetical protein